LAEHRQRPGNPGVEYQAGARVPAYLPQSLQERYRGLFSRTYYFYSSGDTDLACQYGNVVAVRETAIHPDFPRHLRKMTSLEAIDLSFVQLPYFDATRQGTVLRDLAPLTNLRGINLYSTGATDADMAWLAACPRLEVIELSDTDIGDHGLAHLSRLPRLRVLNISSDRISDRGCRWIAQMPALEELELGSRNVHDAGIIALAQLRTLRKLKLSTRATEKAFEVIRTELPKCDVRTDRY